MMRWILGLLLLLNLGLFLWIQTRFEPPAKEPQTLVEASIPEIYLLREVTGQDPARYEEENPGHKLAADLPPLPIPPLPDAPPQPSQSEAVVDPASEALAVEPETSDELATVSESQAVPVAKPETVCGRVGPYTDKEDASRLRQKSRVDGLTLTVRETSEEIKTGYWVLIPALPSRAEAKAMVANLKQAGVTDLWLFSSGPMKNSISLGMYAGINNASRHSRNINKKGFTSEVSPKYSQQPRYWLEYTAIQGQAFSGWLEELPKALENEKKACD